MKQYVYLVIWVLCLWSCGARDKEDNGSTLDIRQIQQQRLFVGEYTMDTSLHRFMECQTQTEYPIAGGEGLKLMQKMFVSMGLDRGTTILAEFEGYVAQQIDIDSESSDMVIMVEKFIHFDPALNCGDIGIKVTQDSLFIQIARELENISYMYQDSVLRAQDIEPGMKLNDILDSEPMEVAFQAYLMAKGGLSRREVLEQVDSLHTVLDVYEILKRK